MAIWCRAPSVTIWVANITKRMLKLAQLIRYSMAHRRQWVMLEKGCWPLHRRSFFIRSCQTIEATSTMCNKAKRMDEPNIFCINMPKIHSECQTVKNSRGAHHVNSERHKIWNGLKFTFCRAYKWNCHPISPVDHTFPRKFSTHFMRTTIHATFDFATMKTITTTWMRCRATTQTRQITSINIIICTNIIAMPASKLGCTNNIIIINRRIIITIDDQGNIPYFHIYLSALISCTWKFGHFECNFEQKKKK